MSTYEEIFQTKKVIDIEAAIKFIKNSLQGKHKKHRYVCEITLKHHTQGTLCKSEELEDLNSWIWLAKYSNQVADDSILIQGDGKTAKEALIDLIYKLRVLDIMQ